MTRTFRYRTYSTYDTIEKPALHLRSLCGYQDFEIMKTLEIQKRADLMRQVL